MCLLFFIQPILEARVEVFSSLLEELMTPQFEFDIIWPLADKDKSSAAFGVCEIYIP